MTLVTFLGLLAYGFAGTGFLTAVGKGPWVLLKKQLTKDDTLQIAADTMPALLALGIALTWLLALLVWPVVAVTTLVRRVRQG